MHPRALYAAPVVYRSRSRRRRPASGEEAAPPPCHAVLDFGHARTNVCIVRDGQTIYARTIRRGGLHLTEAIAKAFQADPDRAEQAKRGEAFLATRAPGHFAAGRQAGRGAARGAGSADARAAPDAGQLPRRAPATTSASLLVVGGGAGWPGCSPSSRRSSALPARFLGRPSRH